MQLITTITKRGETITAGHTITTAFCLEALHGPCWKREPTHSTGFSLSSWREDWNSGKFMWPGFVGMNQTWGSYTKSELQEAAQGSSPDYDWILNCAHLGWNFTKSGKNNWETITAHTGPRDVWASTSPFWEAWLCLLHWVETWQVLLLSSRGKVAL